MSWTILGLVLLVVTYLSLKGTVLEMYCGKRYIGECHIPVWVLLVLGLLYIIPIIGIVVFIVYDVVFLIYAIRKPTIYSDRFILKLSSKNILHRILVAAIHFLNKGI